MIEITPWILALMVGWVPPQEGDTARYNEIAQDITQVAEEAPIFPESEGGTVKTAIYLAAIASMESFYRKEVDDFSLKGDGGLANGLLQVHFLPGERCETRIDCLRIGRDRVKLSFELCRRMPKPETLSHFMTGRCQTNPDSRYRMWRAESAWKQYRRLVAQGIQEAPR